jgi:hypothetical protein
LLSFVDWVLAQAFPPVAGFAFWAKFAQNTHVRENLHRVQNPMKVSPHGNRVCFAKIQNKKTWPPAIADNQVFIP